MNRRRRGNADDVPRPAAAVPPYRETRYPILQRGSVRVVDVEEVIVAKARIENDSQRTSLPARVDVEVGACSPQELFAHEHSNLPTGLFREEHGLRAF